MTDEPIQWIINPTYPTAIGTNAKVPLVVSCFPVQLVHFVPAETLDGYDGDFEPVWTFYICATVKTRHYSTAGCLAPLGITDAQRKEFQQLQIVVAGTIRLSLYCCGYPTITPTTPTIPMTPTK